MLLSFEQSPLIWLVFSILLASSIMWMENFNEHCTNLDAIAIILNCNKINSISLLIKLYLLQDKLKLIAEVFFFFKKCKIQFLSVCQTLNAFNFIWWMSSIHLGLLVVCIASRIWRFYVTDRCVQHMWLCGTCSWIWWAFMYTSSNLASCDEIFGILLLFFLVW